MGNVDKRRLGIAVILFSSIALLVVLSIITFEEGVSWWGYIIGVVLLLAAVISIYKAFLASFIAFPALVCLLLISIGNILTNYESNYSNDICYIILFFSLLYLIGIFLLFSHHSS